jgi:adenylosuccinate synthase
MNGNDNDKSTTRNRVTVVLGSQWGDEGKGKLVDLLAEDADIVARCQGGNNAGHTVVAKGINYAFHLLPSGLVHPEVKAVLGNGVVIHVPEFLAEIKINEDKGMAPVTPDRLKISDRAHLVFDLHKQADGHQEEQRNKNNEMLGTTKKGIGPCYSSKAYRSGIRMADLIAADFDNKFAERFRRLANDHIKAFAIEVDIEAEIERYRSLADDIRPYVTETVSLIHRDLAEGRRILVRMGA